MHLAWISHPLWTRATANRSVCAESFPRSSLNNKSGIQIQSQKHELKPRSCLRPKGSNRVKWTWPCVPLTRERGTRPNALFYTGIIDFVRRWLLLLFFFAGRVKQGTCNLHEFAQWTYKLWITVHFFFLVWFSLVKDVWPKSIDGNPALTQRGKSKFKMPSITGIAWSLYSDLKMIWKRLRTLSCNNHTLKNSLKIGNF